MKKYIFIFSGLVIFSMILGAVFEAMFPPETKGSIFARSGAAIVVLGSLFSLIDLSKVPIAKYWTLDEIDKANKRIGENPDKLEIIRTQFELLYRSINYKETIFKFEAFVLIFGTFIWGFGDYIYLIIC
jgi:hypothetical protein